MMLRLQFRLVVVGLIALTGMAHARCPSWPTEERFLINGDRVTDLRTGVVWARCSVGQTLSGGRCSGKAARMSHEAALAYAQGQVGWRLPNVKELFSLADKGCLGRVAIDGDAFPDTLGQFYWSSTPVVGGANRDVDGTAWAVFFGPGLSVVAEARDGDGNKDYFFVVRLVRISQ